jgi:hypothetical protein
LSPEDEHVEGYAIGGFLMKNDADLGKIYNGIEDDGHYSKDIG